MQTTIRCSTSETINLVLPWRLEKLRAMPLTSWYDSNLPAGNLKKYHTMNFGDSKDKNNVTHTICMNNEEIKTVGKLELLGVILDSKLH